GSQASDVPLMPDESPMSESAKAAFMQTLMPIMSAMQWMMSAGGKLGGGAGASGGSLGRWMAGKLAGMRSSLEAHRFRELQRLMDLMKRDPDLGLQFALPLTGP